MTTCATWAIGWARWSGRRDGYTISETLWILIFPADHGVAHRVVGSIGLAGTLSMNILERTREIKVIRAISAHDRIVTRLVTEGC